MIGTAIALQLQLWWQHVSWINRYARDRTKVKKVFKNRLRLVFLGSFITHLVIGVAKFISNSLWIRSPGVEGTCVQQSMIHSVLHISGKTVINFFQKLVIL